MRHIAIILAAGQGKRMKSKVAKQYLEIRNKPILYYAVKQFEDGFIDDIILVTGTDNIDYCREQIAEKYNFTKIRAIVAGGRERYHSVYQGLLAADKLLQGSENSIAADSIQTEKPSVASRSFEACVYIHDGVRPLITQEILIRARDSVMEYGSGVVGMPVKDTIKISNEEGFVEQTPKRSLVWQIQTPQCFIFTSILAAYSSLIEREEELITKGIAITDDAMVMELLGDRKVKLVEGSYMNLKITTPEDLDVAETFLKEQKLIKG